MHHASNLSSARPGVPNRIPTLLAAVLLSSSGLQAAPDPIVDLRFNEGEGTVVANGGLYGGSAYFATVGENSLPYFTNNIPTGPYAPVENTFAVAMEEIGGNTGGRAIDLITDIGNLGTEFPALTICGWVNARSLQVGPGGNRIVECFETSNGQNGFDLVHNAEGKLILSINQFPDNLPASSGGITANPNLDSDNWVFFAVTWDPALDADQVKYYFGTATNLAYFDSSRTYTLPAALPVFDYAGPLTVGNFVSAIANRNTIGANSRQFRGLLDEIRVYTNALSLAEIHQAQMNSSVLPEEPVTIVSQPPTNVLVHAGQSLTFNVLATGTPDITYQWQTNNVNVPGATSQQFTLTGLTTADDGMVVRVLVDNEWTPDPGVASAGTTLTVFPEDFHKISASFSEGNGTTTANYGNLAGYGKFQVNNEYPRYSTNVPTGPFAPSASHNRASLDMGLIYAGQGNRAVDFTNSFGMRPGTLGGFTGLTICGWLNSGHTNIGSGGNRIVSALLTAGGSGFELVHLNDGSLQFGVNQYPNNTPTSLPGMITSDENGSNENWVFFAVTYDSTLETEPVKFYFGKPDQKVTFSSAITYSTSRGVIDPSGVLTLGNFGSVVAARTATGTGNSGSRCFRGLMDEIQIFNRVLTLEEIEAVQVAPALPTALQITHQGDEVSLSWESTQSLQLQSRTSLTTGDWSDVTVTPEVSGNVRTVTLPATQQAEFFRLSP